MLRASRSACGRAKHIRGKCSGDGALEIGRNCGSNASMTGERPARPRRAPAPLSHHPDAAAAVRFDRRRAGRDRAAVCDYADMGRHHQAADRLGSRPRALSRARVPHDGAGRPAAISAAAPPCRTKARWRCCCCPWRRRSQAWRRSSPSWRPRGARSCAACTSCWRSSRSCCPGPSSTPFSRCTTRTSIYGEGRARQRRLQFPGEDKPDYWDFAYFSFVIGMTFQVSDVRSSTKRDPPAGRWRMAILSFVFNAALLALTVNIAASG